MEIREYNGQTYYLLNKDGTYHDLKLDDKVIDTVTVDKDKTFIEMYITPPERTGGESYYGLPINLLAEAEKEAEFVSHSGKVNLSLVFLHGG